MCVWYQLRACCDYPRNNVPIQLLYVYDNTPWCIISGFRAISQIFTTHTDRLRSCLAANSLLEETFVIRHTVSSRLHTAKSLHGQIHALATTVFNELTSNQAPNLRRVLCFGVLNRLLHGVNKCTTPTCTSHKPPFSFFTDDCRQAASTGLSTGSFWPTAQILSQKGDWGNGGEWSWPVHTVILVFSVLLTSHGRGWVLSSSYTCPHI